MSKTKIILHAELNNGHDITDREMRLLDADLERRGFEVWWDRFPTSKFGKLEEILGTLKDYWKSI